MPGYKALTDNQLADLLQKGDASAYTEIYNRYHAALYMHVFNKLRSREEARDIVHELFRNIWEKREELSVQGTLAAYLYGAARYQVFGLIARRQVAARHAESIRNFAGQHPGATDHLVRERQLLALIEREITALPPKMREVFELSRVHYLTHQQIAEKLGLSEKTVKKQVNNSLKILRSKLGPTLFTAFCVLLAYH